MTEYLRTNYRLTGSKIGAGGLTSVIVQISTGVLSCAGYLFGSTGYGVPSAIWAQGLSIPGPAASCKGEATDSTMEYYGFGPGSVSGSVYFVTAFAGRIHGCGDAGTISTFNAVDAYDTATPSTSVSVRALLTMVIGSV